jgi:hypothetical protein
MTTWNQCSIVMGSTERVDWVRDARVGLVVGGVVGGWRVATVYAPAVGPCEKCGDRCRYPGSRRCLRCTS